jgi:hypothetical protein
MPKQARGVHGTVTGDGRSGYSRVRQGLRSHSFRSPAFRVDALDFSSFLTLLDYVSDIKELRMCWQLAAAV